MCVRACVCACACSCACMRVCMLVLACMCIVLIPEINAFLSTRTDCIDKVHNCKNTGHDIRILQAKICFCGKIDRKKHSDLHLLCY